MSEYCILPLGSPVSENEEDSFIKVQPVMLFGPEGTPRKFKKFLISSGSGKTMLVNSIATATNAFVFNISPRNTAGQYVGKSNVTKMIHMVFKVAKANAPSIIYVDGFEMIFAKKVPKTDTSDPKRIKKDFLKQMKGLSPKDRVLVVGTSRKPWEGDAKAIVPLFPKILYCPKPDYLSRLQLWEQFLSKRMGDYGEIDASLLSRLSNGLTAGQIKQCVDKTLNSRRMNLVRFLFISLFVDYLGPHSSYYD